MNNSYFWGVAAIVALVALHSCNSQSPPVAASQKTVIDYGDDHSQVPAGNQPLGAGFTSIPPVVSSPDGIAGGVSAFEDVKPEPDTEVSKKAAPVAATPPRGKDEVPEPTEEPSAFSDIPKEEMKAGPVGAAPQASKDWINNVFPIRSTTGSNCSAVAISQDTLLTVYHVAKAGAISVGVNNQWVPATALSIQRVDEGARDGSLLKIPNGRLPAINVRAPQYYEPVTVYGFRTKTAQRGFISAARTVSLLPENQGVGLGDSGGAVVADDGSLVGIINGFESASPAIGTPLNTRVVYMVRGDLFLPYIQRSNAGPGQPMQSAPPAFDQPPPPAGSPLPGQASTQDQPSAFDPPPQVNQWGQQQHVVASPDCGNPNCPVHGHKHRVKVQYQFQQPQYQYQQQPQQQMYWYWPR